MRIRFTEEAAVNWITPIIDIGKLPGIEHVQQPALLHRKARVRAVASAGTAGDTAWYIVADGPHTRAGTVANVRLSTPPLTATATSPSSAKIALS
jgi:hypothetical protein